MFFWYPVSEKIKRVWVAVGQLCKSDTALGQGSMVTEFVDRPGLECRDFPSGTLRLFSRGMPLLRVAQDTCFWYLILGIGEQ